MTIYQSRSFAQKVKKMLKQEKEILDQEVQRIVQNPSIGDKKKGDLTLIGNLDREAQSPELKTAAEGR